MSVTHDDYRRARHIAEEAGKLLAAALRTSPRGRPSRSPGILLTGMLLALDTRGMATITCIHDILTRELSLEDQWDLGVRTAGTDGQVRVLSRADLYNMTRRITDRLDHAPIRTPDLSDGERDTRRGWLHEITQALIDATLMPRPEGSADFAVDGTAAWAFAKGLPGAAYTPSDLDTHEEDLNATPDVPPQRDRACAESTSARAHRPTDAGWGVKTAKLGGRETYFGYDVQAVVRVSPRKAPDLEPALLQSLTVLPAGWDFVEPLLQLLDRMTGGGVPIHRLIVDRHYSYKRYDRWVSALLQRGIRQVVDLHSTDQGFLDWDGGLVAAGWLHCPHTPGHLGSIPALGPNATADERRQFALRIAERQAYAAQRVDRLDATGRIRFRCPALNGTVGCPLRPGTEAAALEHGFPIVTPTGESPLPRLCTQNTVQLHITTAAQARAMKVHQEHYWGSPNWIKDYARRTFVEGFFGVLKSASATGHRRGTHQFDGLPLVTLVIACAAAVTNMRLLRSWHERTGRGPVDHPLLQPDRPFHGFKELTDIEAAAIDAERTQRGSA